MQPRYDFASFYKNDKLSDCSLLIRIDGDVKQRLPGHGIVLSNVSPVWRDVIEQQQGLGGRPSIHLDVRPDQVQAACALVRFVYTGDLPEPAAGQQCLLVHMLALAHTFGVTDCRTACYAALMQCQQLQADALGLAFMLLSPLADTGAAAASTAAATVPATGAAATPGFGALLRHCLDQLQQQLGDMEAVLSCPAQLAQACSLPLPALLALLQDARTSAVSENTVLAVVHSWMTAAAQRDVRVDAVQREALAGAVRVPLLEPCYLGTVLPRMAWLLEILGPQGLAMAAGVARGLCDPHAEPVLGNPRACGPLAAGWLKGPRPVPANCSRAMHGGPALSINWTLPLSDIQAAFEAACADAAARAAARQLWQQQLEAAAAAAAAAGRQAALVSSEAPAWGLGLRSPMAAASAAAAMNAVASVAAAAAARVFKRKRSYGAASLDEGGRDQQSSSTAAVVGAGRMHHRAHEQGPLQQQQQVDKEGDGSEQQQEEQEVGQLQAHHTQPGSQQQAADSQGAQADMEEDLAPTRKRRRRAAGTPPAEAAAMEAAAVGAAQARPGSSQAVHKLPGQPGNRLTPPLSPQGGLSGAAAGAGAGTWGFFSQEPLPATAAAAGAGVGAGATAAGAASPKGAAASTSSAAQQLPRHLKLRSQEAQFAGYVWRLVLYFQRREAGTAAAAAAGPAGAEGAEADVQQGGRSRTGGRGAARQAVAAAHAVRLPDEPDSSAAAPAAAAGAATGHGTAGCCWTARLAVEAWPAVALQPGSTSTVAFSGNLAVRLNDTTTADPATAEPARGRQRQGRKAAAAAAASPRVARVPGSSQDVAPSPGRRHRPDGSSPARYTLCPEAAAAAAASPAGGRQLAAAAAAGAGEGGPQRGLQAHAGYMLSIPESDGEGSQDSEGRQPSSPSGDEGESRGVQDSEVDDEGFTMVGEFPSGSAAAAAAAAVRGTPRSSGRRRQQQQRAPRSGRGAGRRPASAGSAGDQDGLAAVTPGGPAGGDAGAEEEDCGSWRVLQLPQGRWLRSRRCDTGFTSFFSISLQQGVWDQDAWEQYLQPGSVLQLRGNIWNVR